MPERDVVKIDHRLRAAVGGVVPGRTGADLRLLVERVDLAPDGMQVRLRAEGLHKLVEELSLRKKAEAA